MCTCSTGRPAGAWADRSQPRPGTRSGKIKSVKHSGKAGAQAMARLSAPARPSARRLPTTETMDLRHRQRPPVQRASFSVDPEKALVPAPATPPFCPLRMRCSDSSRPTAPGSFRKRAAANENATLVDRGRVGHIGRRLGGLDPGAETLGAVLRLVADVAGQVVVPPADGVVADTIDDAVPYHRRGQAGGGQNPPGVGTGPGGPPAAGGPGGGGRCGGGGMGWGGEGGGGGGAGAAASRCAGKRSRCRTGRSTTARDLRRKSWTGRTAHPAGPDHPGPPPGRAGKSRAHRYNSQTPPPHPPPFPPP